MKRPTLVILGLGVLASGGVLMAQVVPKSAPPVTAEASPGHPPAPGTRVETIPSASPATPQGAAQARAGAPKVPNAPESQQPLLEVYADPAIDREHQAEAFASTLERTGAASGAWTSEARTAASALAAAGLTVQRTACYAAGCIAYLQAADENVANGALRADMQAWSGASITTAPVAQADGRVTFIRIYLKPEPEAAPSPATASADGASEDKGEHE